MTQAVIDWGDGTTDTNVPLTPDSGGNWAFSGKTHAYAAAGEYTITVNGITDSDTVKVEVGAPPPAPATGATAGIPGTWTPPGSIPPASAGAAAGIVATPSTPWTTGQYVQGTVAGAAGRMTWSGTNWVGGVAP